MDVEAEQTIGEAEPQTHPPPGDLDIEHLPPDGGWAWLVLVGCFTINFITDGCAYSFGVLYTELLAYFGETKSKTSWVGSLFFSVPLLCGPVASVITARVGCRKATIAGGVIAFLGFLSSSFVQSVEALYVTYGIVAGFGISLPYLTSILIISHYFRKRLAFATGVAECGAGIGTIVFAPLTEALLSQYGWRGTMLILAGITGNIVLCGALFRPAPGTTISRKFSVENIEMTSLTAINGKTIDRNSKLYSDTGDSEGEYDLVRQSEGYVDANSENIALETDILYCEQNCKAKCGIERDRTGSRSRRTKPICGASCFKRIRNVSDVMQLSIFKNPIFLIFVVSSFILYFWFDTPFVYLANRAVECKMSKAQAALLVSVIGVLHTIGNLLFGLAGDNRRLSLPLLYGVSISMCGVSLLFVPYYTTFVPLAIIAGVFGLLSASSEALSSVLLIDILGMKYLSQSYGFTMLLKGIANLIGPPVAGWLFDKSGNYDNTFYAAGACLIVAGLMYTPAPWLRRSRCYQPPSEEKVEEGNTPLNQDVN